MTFSLTLVLSPSQTYLTIWVNPARLTFILPTMLHLVRPHYLDGRLYRKAVGLNSITARRWNYGRRKDMPQITDPFDLIAG